MLALSIYARLDVPWLAVWGADNDGQEIAGYEIAGLKLPDMK